MLTSYWSAIYTTEWYTSEMQMCAASCNGVWSVGNLRILSLPDDISSFPTHNVRIIVRWWRNAAIRRKYIRWPTMTSCGQLRSNLNQVTWTTEYAEYDYLIKATTLSGHCGHKQVDVEWRLHYSTAVFSLLSAAPYSHHQYKAGRSSYSLYIHLFALHMFMFDNLSTHTLYVYFKK